MSALYDRIGRGYAALRRPDPRVARAIAEGLAGARRVLNVGAGAGSYEPRGEGVVAVEPSATMIRQRPPGAAPAVRATAEALPFGDASFDAALAILTLHHWPDRIGGLEELARVARDRVVLLTWDPGIPKFWIAEYFPEIWEVDRRIFPSLEQMRRALGRLSVREVPIPWDCRDGFLGAYWRRPERYLDPETRAAISSFARMDDPEPGLARLRADLASGEWHRRHGSLLDLDEIDLGYRLVVAS